MDLYDQDTDARWMDGDSRVMGTAYKYVLRRNSGIEPEAVAGSVELVEGGSTRVLETLALVLKYVAVGAVAAAIAAIFTWCVYVVGYVEGVEDVRAGTVEIWP